MRAVPLLVLAVLASVSQACGDVEEPEPAAQESSTTTTRWALTELHVKVMTVHRLVDDLHVEVTTEPIPVAGGEGDCGIDLQQPVEQGLHHGERPTVLFEARRADGQAFGEAFDGTFAGCSLEPRTTTAALTGPLVDERVTTREPYTTWILQPDRTFVRCTLPLCDPVTGFPPDPNGCDDTLRNAVKNYDVPKRSRIDVVGCDGGFAVVDVDIGASACPAGDGEPNPCAGERIDRMYWQRVDGRWDFLAYGSRGTAGCAGANLPSMFPRRLCEDLPPAGQAGIPKE